MRHPDRTISDDMAERRTLMSALASANAAAIQRGIDALDISIKVRDLRPVETGLVMLRGRIGGDGAPFNVGEATVTRAAIQLDSGERGFSYSLGRDRTKARLAAICDALLQSAHRAMTIEHILKPLQAAETARRETQRAQAAATRVDFFTLVRGEDAA